MRWSYSAQHQCLFETQCSVVSALTFYSKDIKPVKKFWSRNLQSSRLVSSQMGYFERNRPGITISQGRHEKVVVILYEIQYAITTIILIFTTVFRWIWLSQFYVSISTCCRREPLGHCDRFFFWARCPFWYPVSSVRALKNAAVIPASGITHRPHTFFIHDQQTSKGKYRWDTDD